MKARIFGTVFLLVVLVLVYGFTQDSFSFKGTNSSADSAPVQSSPAPDNGLSSLKTN